MAKVLIESCEVVVTMDDAGTEIAGGSILLDDGVVAWAGAGTPPDAGDATRVDGRGTVAIPGLVNTHHHLFQTMTRARAQEHGLFDWLVELLPVWAGLDADWVGAGARVGMAELALSGCSTTTDHHYVFPQGAAGLLEAEIDAAAQIGMRFHPCRGSMDMGESLGGLPPDETVQDVDTILGHTEEMIGRFHDPSPGSMLRIAVAPCTPFSASEQLMRGSAELARRLGVRLHTHIAETRDEETFCRERFGMRPLELLDHLDWLGPDVWLAHGVHLSEDDVRRVAQTGSGVAWCPSSNMRLGSGLAPARALLDAGAAVGLGVDGSASNDAGDMLAEARQGLFSVRATGGAAAMTVREALRVATRGGAACLGRDDIGSIEPGKRGDVALIPLDGLSFAGAEADPVAALLFCAPHRVRHLFVEGRQVVTDAHLAFADEDDIGAQARRIGRRLAGAR